MSGIVEVYVVNAFVADNQGGNPAGVVLNGAALSVPQMQAIAADLGYSETAFVLPSEQADFRVRFFTPNSEVEFCGHATVGVFATLFHLGKITAGDYSQQTGAGVLAVTVSDEGRVTMSQTLPQFGEEFSAQELAPLLGLNAESILATGLPVKAVSTGLMDVIVPVGDEKQLLQITPDFEAIRAFNAQTGTLAIHVFALTPTESDISARCRNFAPSLGIEEESATGSAAGALAAYLHLFQGGKYRYLFEQGEVMQRRSLLWASVESDQDVISAVCVGGMSDKPVRIPYRLEEKVTS